MKYLTSSVETYRVDTEVEAVELIEEAKANSKFILAKYSSTKKERKSKGEVIDEWYAVTLTKRFNDEKEPNTEIAVSYEVIF